jgi:hypothetical protein
MTALLEDKARATLGMIITEAVQLTERRSTPAEADTFWSQTMAVLAEDVRNARAGTERVSS